MGKLHKYKTNRSNSDDNVKPYKTAAHTLWDIQHLIHSDVSSLLPSYTHYNTQTLIIIIILTNAGILLIGPIGTHFSEPLIGTHTFSFKKLHMKMLSSEWRPYCLGLNVLRPLITSVRYREYWCSVLQRFENGHLHMILFKVHRTKSFLIFLIKTHIANFETITASLGNMLQYNKNKKSYGS